MNGFWDTNFTVYCILTDLNTARFDFNWSNKTAESFTRTKTINFIHEPKSLKLHYFLSNNLRGNFLFYNLI